MERRRFERFQMNNFLTYKPSRFRAVVESMTNDISLKGASIISEKELEPQKNIEMKIFFGPRVGSKVLNSKVIYSRPIQDKLGKGYVSGVEFSNLIFSDRKDLLDNEL